MKKGDISKEKNKNGGFLPSFTPPVDDKVCTEKVYEYTRTFIRNDGTEGFYTQRIPYMSKKDDQERSIKQYADSLLTKALIKTREMRKLDKMVNAILRFKGYNCRNMEKQINKVKQLGTLSIKEEKLIRDIYGRNWKIANDCTDVLESILELYNMHDSEIKEIKDALNEYQKP